MNKLFLFAALASLLFAVPLAFADSDSAGASAGPSGGSAGAQSEKSGPSAPAGAAAAPASSSKGEPPASAPAPAGASQAAPASYEGKPGGAAPAAIQPSPGSKPGAAASHETQGGASASQGAKPAPATLQAPKAKPKGADNASSYVIVIPQSASLTVGQSLQFEAYLVVNGGVPQDVDFAWSVIGGIGTVTQNGLFTATAAGNGTVAATYAPQNVSGSASVAVTNGPPPPPPNNTTAYFFMVPPNATLSINDTQQFEVYAMLPNGTVLQVPDSDLAWSTAGGIGTVSATGLFTATAAGNGTVDANYTGPLPAGIQGAVSAPVTVLASPPPQPGGYYVLISPASATLPVGATQQFAAQLYDANGTYLYDLPSQDVFWDVQNATVGAIDPSGLFSALSAGSTLIKAAYVGANLSNVTSANVAAVTVLASPPPNATYYISVSPSAAILLVGATQQFAAQLYDANGTYLYDLPNSEVSWSSDNAAVGTVDALGVFIALSAGSTLVNATYAGANLTNVTSPNPANVTVNAAPPPANVSYMLVTPDPASLFVGQSQQFIATAYDANNSTIGVLANSDLNWSVTSGIGSIDANGTFTATAAGIGSVTAAYLPNPAILANASVTVSVLPPSQGGGGFGSAGSNNAGGSYKTSTTVSFSCAGKAGEVKITVFDSKVTNATVDIIYLGEPREKVFSTQIAGTTVLSFRPERAGDYELRVSVGTDQASTRFSVPYCGPQTQNVTTNVTVRLAPSRELIFTKLVKYPGGFSKLFSVYKITDGQSEEFETAITLYFNYTGSSARQDFDILDSVPTSVVARTGQITFADRPSAAASEPSFEWHVRSISPGGRLSYSYSFPRPVTEQMISLFGAPSIRSAEAAPAQAKPQDAGLLAASIGPIFGIKLQFFGVALVSAVLLALLYFFMFRKREEE